MSAKQIEVTCPCCATRLTVDVLTSKVMRQSQAPGAAPAGAEDKDRWSSAQERVRDRTTAGEDKLKSALEYERTKGKRFDDLFDKAKDKHVRGTDGEPAG
ncbi:MAG TPA: hypothetical protein VGR31_05555 [Planctomycetota bacterium]|jgi:hypothetical protein|nr:hypothetical protein [Planctomycetota bacterium]